jgi:hypothetical protein
VSHGCAPNPTSNGMNGLLAGVHLLIIGYLGFRMFRSGQHLPLIRWFWPSFLLRLAGGLALGWVFTYSYPASDTRTFFQDGLALAQSADQPWAYFEVLVSSPDHPFWEGLHSAGQPRAQWMVKVQSLVSLATGGNFWIGGLYYSLLAFWAAWYLANLLSSRFLGTQRAALVAFHFLPSLVFWCSGITKESLAMAALFYLAGMYVEVLVAPHRLSWYRWLLLILSGYVLWSVKYYFAIVAGLAMGSHALFYLLTHGAILRSWPVMVRYLLLPLGLALLIYGALQVHPNFHPARLPAVVVENYHEYQKKSPEGNTLHFPKLAPTWASLIWHLPEASLAGILRPHMGEGGTLFKRIAALENGLVLVMVLLGFGGIGRAMSSKHWPLMLATLGYIMLLSAFLALSAPNLGTLIRYKTGFLSFLVYLAGCGWPRQVPNYFHRLVGTGKLGK